MKFKRPNSLCGILLCLMVCPSVVAQTTQAQIRMHYERAQKDLQANQPEDAKLEFQAILKLDPNNAEAHANLGLIAFAGANYETAAADLRAALKIAPPCGMPKLSWVCRRCAWEPTAKHGSRWKAPLPI